MTKLGQELESYVKSKTSLNPLKVRIFTTAYILVSVTSRGKFMTPFQQGDLCSCNSVTTTTRSLAWRQPSKQKLPWKVPRMPSGASAPPGGRPRSGQAAAGQGFSSASKEACGSHEPSRAPPQPRRISWSEECAFSRSRPPRRDHRPRAAYALQPPEFSASLLPARGSDATRTDSRSGHGGPG